MSTFKIKNFAGGLNQALDDSALAVNQSRNAQNVDVSSGTLKVIGGYSKYVSNPLPAAVTRLMKFYKNNTTTGAVTSYLLAATATGLYYWNGTDWAALGTAFTAGDWDFLNYQIAATDVIIMGNGADGLKKWDGTTLAALGGNPPNAKSLALHSERLWATGVKAFPNTVYYSDDLNPENWTSGVDAGGEIYIPTWDGGVCLGIANIFDDVVIFKTNNICRVVGTYPSVYEVKQVYSSVGAIAEKTIVCGNDKAYFLSKDGLYYYNGVSAYPLLGDKARDIIINPAYAKSAVSVVYKEKLYCAFPEGSSAVNNAVLVYDIGSGAFMLWRGLNITDFLEFEDKLLFAGSSGYVYCIDEASASFDGAAISAFWETPWQDLDAFRVTKTADTLYFYAKGNGILRVDITFDGKTKTKNVTLSPKGKLYSLSLNLEGRRFKLKFSNVSGSFFELTQPELSYEADED